MNKLQADSLGYFYGVYCAANLVMAWIEGCNAPEVQPHIVEKVYKAFGKYGDLDVVFARSIEVYDQFLVWDQEHFADMSELDAINVFITEQILKIEEE